MLVGSWIVVIWPCRMPMLLVHDLDHRREAVRGARRRRQQPVLRRIVEMIVDADDDVERALILDGRGDDDPLHAAIEVGLQLLGLQKLAGAFENDVAAEIAPRHIAGRRGFGEARCACRRC